MCGGSDIGIAFQENKRCECRVRSKRCSSASEITGLRAHARECADLQSEQGRADFQPPRGARNRIIFPPIMCEKFCDECFVMRCTISARRFICVSVHFKLSQGVRYGGLARLGKSWVRQIDHPVIAQRRRTIGPVSNTTAAQPDLTRKPGLRFRPSPVLKCNRELSLPIPGRGRISTAEAC